MEGELGGCDAWEYKNEQQDTHIKEMYVCCMRLTELTGELMEGELGGCDACEYNKQLMDTWLSRTASTSFFFAFARFTGLLRTRVCFLFSTRFRFGRNVASRLIFLFEIIFCSQGR